MDATNLRRVRLLLSIFVTGLVVSGLTAIPLQRGVGLLDEWVGHNRFVQATWPQLAAWIERVHIGVEDGYGRYPFLAYGTDWLAFGHVAIAVAFIGPLRNPVRNIWVVEFGMVTCMLVIPWAAALGALRGVPPFWRLIDMSFGVFGIVPLWLARRTILLAVAER